MRNRTRRITYVALVLGGVSGCSQLVDVGAPSSTLVPPNTVNSYQGAVGMYYGTIGLMQQAMPNYAFGTGLFTDELGGGALASSGGGAPGSASPVDARTGNDTVTTPPMSDAFSAFSKARIQAQQALGGLAQYPKQASPNMVAELYALEGIAEVTLTELYCNGIPLTTAPYGKDFQYSAALPSTDVLTLAIAHFDTALALVKDSLAISTLASVGKGRALLNLGRFADAATAVANVPTSAIYSFTYYNKMYLTNPINGLVNGVVVTTSGEGRNGIPWTHNDPRIPMILPDSADSTHGIENKYPDVASPFTVADGVEARLIEAEARLYAKDYAEWIGILQTLAQSVPGVPIPTDPGAVAGNDSARVTVHFRERAYWLFLTGHRQGDTRRLMRQYRRSRQTVVPTGPYSPRNSTYGVYGTDINLSPPIAETQNNPLYKGCLDRNP